MKKLLILRHAKSSWKDGSLPDHDRPLNKRGKEDASRMGRLMRNEDLLPDLILSSTAERARVTVELIVEESGYEGVVEYRRELYATGPEVYIESISGLPDKYERVMVVGHNPGLEQLLEELIGEYQPLSTAALALVKLPIQNWAELHPGPGHNETNGTLVNIWRPKEL